MPNFIFDDVIYDDAFFLLDRLLPTFSRCLSSSPSCPLCVLWNYSSHALIISHYFWLPPPFSSPLSSWLPFFLPSCVFVYSIGPVRLTLIACKNPATESSDRLPKRKIKNQRLWNWIKLFLLFLVVKVYNSGFDWQRPGLTFMTLLTLYPLPSQRLI